MPIVKIEQINEDTKILIWYLIEDSSFFENHLKHLYDHPSPWSEMIPKRKKEFLATRYLIQLGLPSGEQISELVKDEYGCPMLPNPLRYFGITHTESHVACVISKSRAGCDIERLQERILSMAHRFMTEDEREWALGDNHLAKTHLIWGIKESAFKTWGRKQIDWKKHIRLDSLEWQDTKGTFTGTIGNQTGSLFFHGGYEYFSDFLFVWSIES